MRVGSELIQRRVSEPLPNGTGSEWRSSLTDRTQRSANAFQFGLRGGRVRHRRLRTARHHRRQEENFVSGSCGSHRDWRRKPEVSLTASRAAGAIQASVGWRVIPVRVTRRVSRCRKSRKQDVTRQRLDRKEICAGRNRQMCLSITHNFCGREETEFDVRQSRKATPHDHIARRWILGSCNIATEPGDLREISGERPIPLPIRLTLRDERIQQAGFHRRQCHQSGCVRRQPVHHGHPKNPPTENTEHRDQPDDPLRRSQLRRLRLASGLQNLVEGLSGKGLARC